MGPTSHTCHRISTEVVVWGVTETMVGASSGAGERGRWVSSERRGTGPRGATGTRFFGYWTVGSSGLSHPPRPPPRPLQNKGSGRRERGAGTLTSAPKPKGPLLRLPQAHPLVFWGWPPAWGTSEKKYTRAPVTRRASGLCPQSQTKCPAVPPIFGGHSHLWGPLPQKRWPSAQEVPSGPRERHPGGGR